MPHLITAVRDASARGGGVAEVSLAIHEGMLDTADIFNTLFVGTQTGRAAEREIVVGSTGSQVGDRISSARPDLVHVHGIWTPFEWRMCRAARAVGSKLVLSPHGALEPWAFASKGWKKRLAWRLYQKRELDQADLLIANSEQERIHLRNLGLANPIAVIANGIDLSDCPPDVLAGPSPSRDRAVLFLGRIDAKKGIPDLLHAWKAIGERKGYALRIHGYGDPGYEASIRREIESLGLNDVAFAPALFGAEKWRAYANSRVFVLPSYSENFGITVAEALYSGCVVITTTATPWRVVEEYRLGWVIPNDRERLRDALQASIDLNEVERRDISLRAHHFACEQFIWQPLVDRYRQTYEWLIVGGPAPEWVDFASAGAIECAS